MSQIRNIFLLYLITRATCTDNDDTLCNKQVTEYEQSDPELVKIIKECFLQPPSDQPYSFSQQEPFIRGQVDQPILVDLIYNKTIFSGFFIEAGAWDGENLSNSLLFELHRGWTGLLVEPDRAGYKSLIGKNRKAWTSPTCLSTERHPMEVKFNENHMLGGIQNGDIKPGMTRDSFKENSVTALCLPLFSLLLSVGNPAIHYFSLDIEGAELLVLKTIPWDKVDIWLLGVETNHGGEVFPWSRMDVLDYMRRLGMSGWGQQVLMISLSVLTSYMWWMT